MHQCDAEGCCNAAGGRHVGDAVTDDNEFVASKTAREIALAHRCHEALADLPQQLIAFSVTVCVIDRLEPIQIERTRPAIDVLPSQTQGVLPDARSAHVDWAGR